MTHVFKPNAPGNNIATEAPEWRAKYAIGSDQAVKIVHAFRQGERETLPEEMPQLLIAEKPRKTWPDAFKTDNGLLVVRGPVRAIIEKLDPGVHQFFPLSFRTKRGLEIDGPWCAMNVTAKQDSIIVEKSRVMVNPRAPDRLCSFYSSSKSKDVVVNPSHQSGLNLWREARFVRSLLGSDRLAEELKRQNLKFFPSYRATDLSDAP